MEATALVARNLQKPGIRILLIFAIGVVGLHIFQEIFIGTTAVGSLISNLLQISCAAVALVACATAVRRAKGVTRPFWTLIGLSFAVWIAANAGWAYYESYLHTFPARDSIFHFFVDCRSLLLAMALLLDPNEEDSARYVDPAWILDIVQLFIIFTLIYLGWYQAASLHQSRELSIIRSDQIELGENFAIVALAVVRMIAARSIEARQLYQGFLVCFFPLVIGFCLTDYREWRTGKEIPTGTYLDLWWSIPFLLTAFWAMRWAPSGPWYVKHPNDRRFLSLLCENILYAAGPLIVLIQVKELGPRWMTPSLVLLGISIACFGARIALSEFREIEAARRVRQVHTALVESEARFRTLIEEAPLAVGITRSAKILWVNRRYVNMFGYPNTEELVGRPSEDLLAECKHETETRALSRSNGRTRPLSYESVGLRKNGTKFSAQFDVAKVILPDGPADLEFVSDISERKTAEIALRESEDRYRDLVEHSEDLVCTHDLQGNLLSVNPAPARILGYEVEELLKIRMQDLVVPEFREQFEAYLELIGKIGSANGLVCVIGKNGRRRIWEFSNTLRTEGVASPVVRGLAHDVTERKLAEEALRGSEERMRLFIEHAPAAAAVFDCEMRYVQASCRWRDDYGLGDRELYGVSHYDVFPEISERWKEAHRRCLSGEVLREEKDRFERADGTVQWIRWEIRPWYQNEKVAGIAMFTEELTEDEKRAEALRYSEARFRILFEKSVAGVAIGMMDGTLTECNDAWARMLGYEDAAECRDGQGSTNYCDPAQRELLIARLSTAGSLLNEEWEFRRKDGNPLWVLLNTTIIAEGDRPPLIQSTIIDITQRKRAEEALRKSEERFRVALKDSPITVFNQDTDLRYTWIYNPQLHWQHDVIGKTDEEIIGTKKAAVLTELKRGVLTSGIAVREEVAIPQNGQRYVFDITIEPLFNSKREVVGITGASIDIARLREMADRLRESTDRLERAKSYLESEIQTELGFEEIIGQSGALREVLRKARVVAPTGSTVLLLGETGTGKELVARSLHRLSARRENTFVKLNCAAVPSGLMESELFGHEKGAFTGAVSQKVGRIELADKGTLFLDEIGELPLELQPKLLRVLQDREFERLGGVKTLHVDVRIIAATNRDLRQDIADKNFREDLFYRINVFPLELPPLRSRRDDIPLLVHHFVKKHSSKMGKHIDEVPSEAMRTLCKWNWPGNIRELENVIERMVIMTRGSVLASPPAEIEHEGMIPEDDLAEMERDHIIRVLRETNGVLSGEDGAANRLGLKRTTLQSMMKRLIIVPGEYRARGDGTFGKG